MIRASAIVLATAVLALVASSIVWLRSTAPVQREVRDDPAAVVADFERAHRPTRTIDVGARYAGRSELLDPRPTLPTWHLHPRAQAAAVFSATRLCPAAPLAIELTDAALAKAYAWHARSCALGAPIPEDLLQQPPFLHPSGRSYAALALLRGGAAHVKTHPRAFHVLELASIDAALLDDDGAVLGTLGPREWSAIASGDRLVLSPSALVVVEHGSLGLSRLRFYERHDWERALRGASLALVRRSPSTTCARPAASALCWQSVTAADRHRDLLVLTTTTSAALVLLAAAALSLAYVRERRRLHADRIHVLRTLTHELRTPAMSLGIDIEPLRAAYDELPTSCQEPLLRMSDGIARLGRILHRSAKYMALFEASSRPENIVHIQEVSSVNDLFADLAEEWPTGTTARALSDDGPAWTDPEWLSIAVRNLVENAVRHGRAPVEVTWERACGELVVRVADAGSTASFSLRRAIAPYHRDPASPGLGLGLAIVHRVAHLLGGSLRHEPSPTVFELRLPLGLPSTDATLPR